MRSLRRTTPCDDIPIMKRFQSSAVRVILVNLPVSNPLAGSPADASVEHIGLGYIGAYLNSKGIKDVKVFDAYSRKLSEKEIVDAIKKFNPEFLCISPTYLTWDLTLRILNKIKDENNNIVTILGGPHVSFEPILTRALKEYKCIDFIVRGEGEISTYEIIEQTTLGSCSRIQGVSHRGLNGELIIAKDFAEIAEDLDSLPFPLRDTPSLLGKSVRLTTSRGCYQNGSGCTFCSTSALYPRGWRARSARNVVDEIEFLNAQGFNNFICAEGDFIGLSEEGLNRASEIAEEILKLKLSVRLRIFAGIPQVLKAEKFGLWGKLKHAGLERVYPGIESANVNTLNLFGKRQSLSEIYSAVEILRKRGIALQVGFIMFQPWSTFESIEENCRFLRYIEQDHLWYNLSSSLLLLPGSKLLERSKLDNLLNKELNQVGLGEEFVHNYKFINSQVGRLFQICSTLLKNPVIIAMDRMLITAEIILSNYVKSTMPSEILWLKRKYEETKEDLSSLNLNTYYKIIKLSKAKSPRKNAELMLKSHISKVEKKASELKLTLTKALKKCPL